MLTPNVNVTLEKNISNKSYTINQEQNFCQLMCGNKMPTRCNRVFFIADLIACSTCFGHH